MTCVLPITSTLVGEFSDLLVVFAGLWEHYGA
jgi:hypothetical protein